MCCSGSSFHLCGGVVCAACVVVVCVCMSVRVFSFPSEMMVCGSLFLVSFLVWCVCFGACGSFGFLLCGSVFAQVFSFPFCGVVVMCVCAWVFSLFCVALVVCVCACVPVFFFFV